MSSPTHWSLPFLQTRVDEASRSKTALIILNQPFSKALLRRLWHATDWHCCADGGANRLHDILNGDSGEAIDTTTTMTASAAADGVDDYLPDLLKGDLDSVREDVRRYYETRVSRCVQYTSYIFCLCPCPSVAVCWVLVLYIISFRSYVSVLFRKGVRVVRDDDQDSTDLMKCIRSLQEKELEGADGVDVGGRCLCTRIPVNLYYFPPSFSDSLRRRLTWWLLWATGSDRPLIIVPTQAPEERTPTIRRHGRERRLGPRRGKGFSPILKWLTLTSTPRLTIVRPCLFRVNIACPSTTRYWGRLVGCSRSEWIRPC